MPATEPMKYVIRFATNWRPDDRTLLGSGDYRVPLDMSDELAKRAIADGVAEYRDAEPDPSGLVMHTTKGGGSSVMPPEPSPAVPKASSKSKGKVSQGKRRAVSD